MLATRMPGFSFSGHETFPFRFAWLPKGVQELLRNPNLFLDDEAMVTLGVGKNMVKSIRFWCLSLGLIEQLGRGEPVQVTSLGSALFGQQGWDQYLEDPATLWLLHWQLVSRPERASTWHLAFTHFVSDPFASQDLLDWLMKFVAQHPGVRATSASLNRDIDVFLRTYVGSHNVKPGSLSEDAYDCPLVQLGLVREVERDLYHFVRGPKSSLPTVIFFYALIDFWNMTAPQQQTLSFEHILHGQGSPGAAFKLSENALAERLEHLPHWTNLIFSDTAGRRQILVRDLVPRMGGLDILRRYYERADDEART